MIEFEILLGTPVYTHIAVPNVVVIPDGAIEFQPPIAGINVLSEEIRYDMDSNGIKWLTCEIVKARFGAKPGSPRQTNLHVNYDDFLILDIPITIYTNREVIEFEQVGGTTLTFVIDPLLSNQQFNLDYTLFGFNKEFQRVIPGLDQVSGSTLILPGQFKTIQFQHVGVIPGGNYTLDAYASDADELKYETETLSIESYAMLIDFGDNSELALVDINSEILHSYEEDGFYTIIIKVDFGGAMAIFTRHIEVRGPLVIADNDFDTWWATDPNMVAPHWIQVSF